MHILKPHKKDGIFLTATLAGMTNRFALSMQTAFQRCLVPSYKVHNDECVFTIFTYRRRGEFSKTISMYTALNLHMPKQNPHQDGITLNTTGVFLEMRSKRAWDWTVAGFKSVSYSSLKSECNSKITIPLVWLPKRKGGDTLQAYGDPSFRIRLSFIWGLIRFKSLSFITRNTVLSFFQFHAFLWTPICD